jgi:hypothetical protein
MVRNIIIFFVEFLDTQRNCDCKSKQLEYFLFNKYLAVPEYLVEFEYMNKVESERVRGL